MRGVAAVFLGSALYPGNDAPAHPNLIAQVCVHELGHMLDLTHSDAVNEPGTLQYANAMNQAAQRATLPAQSAWGLAEQDAHSRGEPPLQANYAGYIYPFNARCRAELRAAAVNQGWWPFQSPFRGGYQGGVEDRSRALSLEIAPHRDTIHCQRDGVLFVSLRLGNETDQPVDLPLHLGLEDGTIRLVMRDDSGEITLHRPTKHRCSGARRLMLPGQSLTVATAAASTDKVPLFSRVGPHQCEFSIVDHLDPASRVLARATLAVDVVETAAGMDAARRLIRASSQKSPDTRDADTAHEDSAIAALNSRRLLASAKASRSRKVRTERLCALFDPLHPLAVRHSAATDFALDRISAGRPWADIAGELSESFSGSEHALLFEQIRRSGTGWATLKASAPEGIL